MFYAWLGCMIAVTGFLAVWMVRDDLDVPRLRAREAVPFAAVAVVYLAMRLLTW